LLRGSTTAAGCTRSLPLRISFWANRTHARAPRVAVIISIITTTTTAAAAIIIIINNNNNNNNNRWSTSTATPHRGPHPSHRSVSARRRDGTPWRG
jgi:hypothetical protein